MSVQVNHEGNELNEKDQKTCQTNLQYISDSSLSPFVISLIDIMQLDNQLSNSKYLMMITKNAIGDMQVSLLATTHSWLHTSL